MRPETDVSKATQLRPAVAAIITDDEGKILLQRRSDKGLWGLPGGSVEIGESVRQAILREVREETGLTVEVLRLNGIYSDPRFQVVRYPDDNVVHYMSILFCCRMSGGTLQTCDETLDLKFLHPTLPHGDLMPMHRIRIEDAIADRSTAYIR